jgi:hypothetical protein
MQLAREALANVLQLRWPWLSIGASIYIGTISCRRMSLLE